jgi:serine/threonine-protein kinase
MAVGDGGKLCQRIRGNQIPDPTTKAKVARLGKYELIAQIGSGGMAQVFLARQVGPLAFQKLVVVKSIHDTLTTSSEFVGMLLDEARVAALIKHPNVVDIYDLGEANGKYFIAMEFIAGRPLTKVLRRAKKTGKALDALSVAYVISQAADGLHAAHSLRSFSGELLNVVHRDVTPGNIMVSYEGGIKLVDFGVAKSLGNLNSTQAGQVKGKFGYLSPEQVSAEPVSAQTDVFSLGIVLWESLVVARLFQESTMGATISSILNKKIKPPSRYRDDVPEELDRISQRALARDPAERYQSAAELRDDLEAFLQKQNYHHGRRKVAEYMQEQFDKEIVSDRAIVTQTDFAAIPAAIDEELSSPHSGRYEVEIDELTPAVTPAPPDPTPAPASAKTDSEAGAPVKKTSAAKAPIPVKVPAAKSVKTPLPSVKTPLPPLKTPLPSAKTPLPSLKKIPSVKTPLPSVKTPLPSVKPVKTPPPSASAATSLTPASGTASISDTAVPTPEPAPATITTPASGTGAVTTPAPATGTGAVATPAPATGTGAVTTPAPDTGAVATPAPAASADNPVENPMVDEITPTAQILKAIAAPSLLDRVKRASTVTKVISGIVAACVLLALLLGDDSKESSDEAAAVEAEAAEAAAEPEVVEPEVVEPEPEAAEPETVEPEPEALEPEPGEPEHVEPEPETIEPEVVEPEVDPALTQANELVTSGRRRFITGDLPGAKKDFLAALKLQPDHPDALKSIAQIYEKSGASGRAVKHYKRYLQRNPQAKDRKAIQARLRKLER